MNGSQFIDSNTPNGPWCCCCVCWSARPVYLLAIAVPDLTATWRAKKLTKISGRSLKVRTTRGLTLHYRPSPATASQTWLRCNTSPLLRLHQPHLRTWGPQGLRLGGWEVPSQLRFVNYCVWEDSTSKCGKYSYCQWVSDSVQSALKCKISPWTKCISSCWLDLW